MDVSKDLSESDVHVQVKTPVPAHDQYGSSSDDFEVSLHVCYFLSFINWHITVRDYYEKAFFFLAINVSSQISSVHIRRKMSLDKLTLVDRQ